MFKLMKKLIFFLKLSIPAKSHFSLFINAFSFSYPYPISTKQHDFSFDPIVVGNNTCFMALGYFPKKAMKSKVLPNHNKFSIPSPEQMQENFPNVKHRPGYHPFMLSFCHGANIHDVYTQINVPQQEELMFVFPVNFKHSRADGTEEEVLCSYVPTLYLNSFMGVLGGLYFGLRKEYRPDMRVFEFDDDAKINVEDSRRQKGWYIENLISASFEYTKNNSTAINSIDSASEMYKVPHFFRKVFEIPFVTVSYPLPLPTTYFYRSKVYTEEAYPADFVVPLEWKFKDINVSSTDNSDGGKSDWSAVFASYCFGMTRPLMEEDFFAENDSSFYNGSNDFVNHRDTSRIAFNDAFYSNSTSTQVLLYQ